MKLTAIALLRTALQLQASAELQLLPAGDFKGRDGRPGKDLTWKLSDEKGRALAARLTAHHATVRFNLDYEHQAMLTEENGHPAPASGWATKFEWRDGKGLYATDVQWTDRARAMIEAGEYLYLSPVIVYDKRTGEITDVINAALTNIPNLDIDPVGQARAARLAANFATHHPEPSDMNPILKALLAALSLPDEATEAQATAALASLTQARTDLAALRKELGVADGADAAAATTAVATLRTKSAQAGGEPDPTKWVSMQRFSELNTQVTQLTAANAKRDVDALIDQAKREGKLTPAAEEVWRNVGKADIAQLRALIDKTPANPALAGRTQTGGNGPENGADETDVNALTRDANKYVSEQAALGVYVSSADAVNHVLKQKKA